MSGPIPLPLSRTTRRPSSNSVNPRIAFTGVRPGEKMFEELYLTGDELTTRHPDILTVPRGDLGVSQMKQAELTTRVERLVRMAEEDAPELLHELRDLANAGESSASAPIKTSPTLRVH